MILVDTSIWVDHIRVGDPQLVSLLRTKLVLVHPFVIGELAVGNLRDRRLRLGFLLDLPTVAAASHDEVLRFIDDRKLFGIGISYIDAHLLAATLLTRETSLWTRDKNLRAAAMRLGFAVH